MGKKLPPVEEVLDLLAYAPTRLAELSDGLAPSRLRTAPAPDEWSANEILAHLRACADVWGKCIATILMEDKPTIKAVDPRTWIKQTNYLELDFEPSLQAFIGQRTDLLAVLQPLPLESWLRSAIMRGSGAPIERTVHSFAYRLVAHERSHLKQIGRIVQTLQT
jgi:hypothetical protein